MAADAQVHSLALSEISPDLWRSGIALKRLVWPPKNPTEPWTAPQPDYSEAARTKKVWHFVCENGLIIAIAESFYRVVATESGRSFTVLALAGVCTHPDHRHQGWGTATVRAAFARLDGVVPISFFQTGVPPFYEAMGARLVSNRIYNSTGDRSAFWDTRAVIYPATADWPDEAIDLLGPGW